MVPPRLEAVVNCSPRDGIGRPVLARCYAMRLFTLAPVKESKATCCALPRDARGPIGAISGVAEIMLIASTKRSQEQHRVSPYDDKWLYSKMEMRS